MKLWAGGLQGTSSTGGVLFLPGGQGARGSDGELAGEDAMTTMRRYGYQAGAILLGLVLVLGCRPGLSSPVELKADWGNLNGTWQFRIDPGEVGEKEGWQQPAFADGGWKTLKAPGNWEAQGVTDLRPGERPHPKGIAPYSDYDGVAWYRLHFVVPKDWAGQALVLSLGSVDDQDRTYLNGKLIGETGPGLADAVQVWRDYPVPADAIMPGEENVLAIRVFDGGGPGGLAGPVLSLIPKSMAEAKMKLPQADRPLAERFTDPPAASRILKIIHGWPDGAKQQDLMIRQLIAQGFGGVVCNLGFDQYLRSEDKWKEFVQAVHAAKDAGMAMWLYDEKGYPSGTAGDLTMVGHPEYEAEGLLIADADSKGGEVKLDLPPGKLVRASAFPVSEKGIDMTHAVDLAANVQDGKLTWQAPAGHWHVMAITRDYLYEGTHSSMSLGDRSPYINLLMPEATARYIELTHEAYAAHLGDDLGKYFISTFTDEPSLMSAFLHAMPYRPLPWAPALADEFRKRRGYDLEPVIPLLLADAGGAEKKVRYDYWLTIGELVSENFFGQLEAECKKHNFRSGGHLLIEESPSLHVPLYGDFFRCIRRLTAPSIDCLTSAPPEVPWESARILCSAADLDGDPFTMCETSDFSQVYRPEGDKRPVHVVSEDEIRGTCNKLMVAGINTITSYYTFRETTAEELKRLNEWVGRCCTMLTGGRQVTDVAVLYPAESLWPHFQPARAGATDSQEVKQIETTYHAVSSSLYDARRDFTFVDSRTLGEAKVEKDGALAYNGMRWRVIVLPRADTMPLAAWENVHRFWQAGGVLICVGARPANSESEFPSPKVEAIAKEMFGDATGAVVKANAAGGVAAYLPPGTESMLPKVLAQVIGPDVAASAGSPLRVTHRRIDGHEVYFIINDSPNPVAEEVTIAAKGPGEMWDPATGKMTAVPGAKVKLDLGPYGGALLRYAEASPPKRLTPKGGGLGGLTLTPMPLAAAASTGQGEFVRAELADDPDHTAEGKPAWRAVGTLTKGKVDTFLFVSFGYPQWMDLTGVDSLMIDTWVPEGQTAGTELLVILRDKDGGDYLANAGRTLGAEGHVQSFIPMSSFKLAGWSKDPNGKLDLDAIAAMSIGWGGYYGTEGERVEFSLALPQIGRLGK